MMKVVTFATVTECYRGMCGILTTIKREVMLSSLSTKWDSRTVARDVIRTKQAIEAAWPEWVPKQAVGMDVQRYSILVPA